MVGRWGGLLLVGLAEHLRCPHCEGIIIFCISYSVAALQVSDKFKAVNELSFVK